MTTNTPKDQHDKAEALDIEAEIKSILSCCLYDTREDVEKDLRRVIAALTEAPQTVDVEALELYREMAHRLADQIAFPPPVVTIPAIDLAALERVSDIPHPHNLNAVSDWISQNENTIRALIHDAIAAQKGGE